MSSADCIRRYPWWRVPVPYHTFAVPGLHSQWETNGCQGRGESHTAHEPRSALQHSPSEHKPALSTTQDQAATVPILVDLNRELKLLGNRKDETTWVDVENSKEKSMMKLDRLPTRRRQQGRSRAISGAEGCSGNCASTCEETWTWGQAVLPYSEVLPLQSSSSVLLCLEREGGQSPASFLLLDSKAEQGAPSKEQEGEREKGDVSLPGYKAVLPVWNCLGSDKKGALTSRLKAKQPQFPQPLLIRLVLQTLHQLRCPSLDTLQHLNVSLVVRGPKLNTLFESLPTLKQINTPAQLGVTCKLTEGALDPFIQTIDKDIKQNWPQHRALGNTACDWPPTGFNSIHHHSLGLAIQPVLYPAKSTPVQAMSIQFLYQENAVGTEVPKDWRKANVTPIFKKGKREDQGNYRPFSLISVPGEVTKQISRQMKHKKIIRSSQH
ncbi:hypothetical protein QYF61_010351 [Mycteria americana]|uniref:Uncharacterized protein n=1 Tax=Mycteria americana TaxID=33587 RepID=A0AAN7NJ56_MYCAM|nr:hypothetical protein QYF61_010351 [Mycteria americana]